LTAPPRRVMCLTEAVRTGKADRAYLALGGDD
jgi:hypothetical protein